MVRLTLDDARSIVAAAFREAEALGAAMVVAVVDAGGHLIALERADGAHLGSIEVAEGKARTAVFYGRSTEVMEQAVRASPGLASLPNFTPFGGGIPILCGESIIGGVAASGGSAEQDIACAEAGLRALQG